MSDHWSRRQFPLFWMPEVGEPLADKASAASELRLRGKDKKTLLQMCLDPIKGARAK